MQLTSPFSDEDQLSYELWVSSNDARHSTATVIEYSGRFIGIEVGGACYHNYIR